MQESKPQLRRETWKERLLFHWMGFRVLVYIVEIAVPVFIDALCGHVWGVAAAVVNIFAWLYFGLKSRKAPGTMILWLFALVYVFAVAIVEFAHLFHWQLTSNGHF
jgi:hypothetical protein